MPSPASKPLESSDPEMDRALHAARIAEGARFDAVMDIKDAQTLRLQVLKDDIQPRISGRAEAAGFIDLALVPGDPPKLWIDLTSYVVMSPDPRTYQLVQDTTQGREVLAQTTDRAEMVGQVTEFIAHRLVARQKALPPPADRPYSRTQGHSTAALILAWLAGFSLGVLALLAVGIMLAKTPF